MLFSLSVVIEIGMEISCSERGSILILCDIFKYTVFNNKETTYVVDNDL